MHVSCIYIACVLRCLTFFLSFLPIIFWVDEVIHLLHDSFDLNPIIFELEPLLVLLGSRWHPYHNPVGLTAEPLAPAGLTVAALVPARLTVAALAPAGLTVAALVPAGLTVAALVPAGLTVAALVPAELTVAPLQCSC